jgi:hypothetical protein
MQSHESVLEQLANDPREEIRKVVAERLLGEILVIFCCWGSVF